MHLNLVQHSLGNLALLMPPTLDETQQLTRGLAAQLIHITLHLQAQCHMLTRMPTVIKVRTVRTVAMVLRQPRRALFRQGAGRTEMVTAGPPPSSTKQQRRATATTGDAQGRHQILALAGTTAARKVTLNRH
jgi:hypothetical protein